MRTVFIILSIFTLSILNAFSLKEKITKGNVGDYIVVEQGGTYTILLIRELASSTLTLEEISIPECDYNAALSWKEWILAKAPGHTSWTAYQIDLVENRLLECYSYSQGTWVYTQDPNHFFTKLLTLSLNRTPEDKRRRIGPPPPFGEVDRRGFWSPPMVVEGKAHKKSHLNAWTGKWPKDETALSGCEIEMYFGDFPFPYWIDVKTTHFMAPLRSIDSGKSLSSPMAAFPQRPPQILGPAQWANKNIEILLSCPLYYSKLNLFVIDLTEETHPTIPVPATLLRGEEERATLKVSEETLSTILQKGHSYRWVIVPEQTSQILAESDQVFVW